jgi:hypothetical protein
MMFREGAGAPRPENLTGRLHVNRLTHGRVKRIHAEFRGDEAVELDILEVTLRLGDVARTRIEADTVLTRLAYKALYRSIEEYCRKTGQRYPTYRTLLGYLDGGPIESEPDAARVVSIAKEAGR